MKQLFIQVRIQSPFLTGKLVKDGLRVHLGAKIIDFADTTGCRPFCTCEATFNKITQPKGTFFFTLHSVKKSNHLKSLWTDFFR